MDVPAEGAYGWRFLSVAESPLAAFYAAPRSISGVHFASEAFRVMATGWVWHVALRLQVILKP